MTGHIKTGGSWKTASKLAVNIAGTWKTASVGYVKVAGAWKQWFAALITDNFARTVAGSLGNTPLGIAWVNVRGTWFANGSKAQSDDAGSTYPLASVPLGSADATVSASVSSGVGVAFWVTDAGSWWAAVPYYNETSSSVYNSCCSTSNYCKSCYSANFGTTTYSSTTTSTYVGSASACDYQCPAGQTASGTSCYYNTTSTTTCKTCNQTYGSGVVTSYTSHPECSPCSGCETGTSGSYRGCQGTTTTTGGGGYAGSATCVRNCDAVGGGTVSYGSCYRDVTTYSCPSGYTDSGGQCIAYGTSCSYCGTGSSCNGCTQTTYSQYYYLRLLSSVAGTVSSPVGDQSLGSSASAIKVVTSGNSVTAQAYSDTLLATPLGTAMTSSTTSTKGTSHGIIKITSDYSQGSTADDFSAGI